MAQSLDYIMDEFRSNGKDVDYVELDLHAIELDRYSPEARSLIVSLLQDQGLDPEMKIIRPPSRTPSYLPTSTHNLNLNYPQHPPFVYSLPNEFKSRPIYVNGPTSSHCNWPRQELVRPSPGNVTDMIKYMGLMNMSNQTETADLAPQPPSAVSGSAGIMSAKNTDYFSSIPSNQKIRPIVGNGSSMKADQTSRKPIRFSKQVKRLYFPVFNDEGPWTKQRPKIQANTSKLDSETQIHKPVSKTEAKANNADKVNCNAVAKAQSCNKYGGSSGEELSIDTESIDSGNFSGESFSSGSELSPTKSTSSIEGEHSFEGALPSYASVLSAPISSFVKGFNDGILDRSLKAFPPIPFDIPKPTQSEVMKALKKNERVSETSEEHRTKECVFCKTNGETPSLYRSHVLKDDRGRTVCHVLQKYVCPLCGATGIDAHTVKYCPKNTNPPLVSMMTTLKAMRSATGNVRMLANSRRLRASDRGKRNQNKAVTCASPTLS